MRFCRLGLCELQRETLCMNNRVKCLLSNENNSNSLENVYAIMDDIHAMLCVCALFKLAFSSI